MQRVLGESDGKMQVPQVQEADMMGWPKGDAQSAPHQEGESMAQSRGRG